MKVYLAITEIKEGAINMNCVQVKNLTFKNGSSKICVPLTGITDYQIMNELEHLRYYDHDLVELRIDYYEKVEDFESVNNLLKKMRKVCDKPILFTFRTKFEGGMHEMSEDKYFSLNNFVIENELVDLIDIELFRNEHKLRHTILEAKKKNIKVILSNHEFLKTPSKDEIVSRLVKMQEHGADITKIAVMSNCEDDVLTLLAATLEMKKEKADRPFMTMAMGSLGIITRLAGQLTGSCITFASLNKSTAPGQISVKNAREVLNIINS
jgi:3-dehydroquinate dehydratase-1